MLVVTLSFNAAAQAAGKIEVAGCDLKARLFALMNSVPKADQRTPASIPSRAETSKALRAYLSAQSISDAAIGRYLSAFKSLSDADFALAQKLLSSIPARRLESPLFTRTLPSVIKEMIAFHGGSDGLDVALAIRTLSEWDDQALLGLGRTYQLARKSLKANATADDRKEALETALSKLMGKTERLKKEVTCADLGY